MNNNTILEDPLQLTKDELVDEYEQLADNYKKLKNSEDQRLQQIYELKRSLETATNAETYLSSELESITYVHKGELNEVYQKHAVELDHLKKNQASSLEIITSLEGDNDKLRKELESARASNAELLQSPPESAEDAAKVAKLQERLAKSEDEQSELVTLVGTVRDQLQTALKQIVQHECVIEDLKDRLECVQATLESKREEIDEKTQQFETAQERILELTSELSAFKTLPETDTEKRGNSLFAEVDDQRQQMKLVLAAQKKHYNQMKQEYLQSQHEIRSLKRENVAMHKELEICSSLFMNADQTYKDKLNERIGQLLNDNKKLEDKLTCTESMLVSIARENGVTWLDSMLTFCKNETTQTKALLHTCRLQKTAAEETLNNTQQDMARWRFEALKSRCVIISRESILEEHNIPFDPDLSNIQKLARKLDTPDVRPNIIDTSSRILNKLRAKSFVDTQTQCYPSDFSSEHENMIVKQTGVEPGRIESVSLNELIESNVKTEPIIKSENDSQSQLLESCSRLHIKVERDMCNNLEDKPIKLEIDEEQSAYKLASPLKERNDNVPVLTPYDNFQLSENKFLAPNDATCDISAILNDTTTTSNRVPQYRNISISEQCRASLSRNAAKPKLVSTPHDKSTIPKSTLKQPSTDSCSDENDIHNRSNPKTVGLKVNFSNSIIEAADRKELLDANPNTVAVKMHESHKPVEREATTMTIKSEETKPKIAGGIRRVIVKSKKPTAFPK